MKVELPSDPEHLSCQLIGALSAVRDLIAGQSPQSPFLPVRSADMGHLFETLKLVAMLAHECQFGPVGPPESNEN